MRTGHRRPRPEARSRGRLAGASELLAGLLAGLLVVVLLPIEPAQAGPTRPAPARAVAARVEAQVAAQVECPPYLFMGSAGSGQRDHAPDEPLPHQGLGREIDDLYTRLDQQMPAGDLGLWVNDYPAVSVPAAGLAALIDLLQAASHDSPLPLRRYAESVGEGVRKLEAAIDERLAACDDTQLILAGYSQGGQVTADAYQALTPAQRDRVLATVVFGDPYFNGRSQAGRGDYSPRRHGLLTFPSAFRKRKEFPDVTDGKVLSFCHRGDPVCQGLFPTFSIGQHTNYDSVGDAASPVPYTQRAATCLALRAGQPGQPGGPVARITPPSRAVAGQEIELSAAQSTDPACEPLGYAWSVDGDAFSAPTGDPRHTVTLAAGLHTVDLRITTPSDEQATDRLTIDVVAPGPDDTGPPGVPTEVMSTPADDGASATLTWEPPARGPPPQGYSVATADGFPLYEGRSIRERSLTLPADTLPVTVVVAARNAQGEGPPSAPVTMAATEPVPGGDLNALWRVYGDAGGHWTGGDSTASVALPDERVAWLFSDTFLGEVTAEQTRPRSSPFVHNSLVVQEADGRLGETLTGGTASAPRSLVELDGSDVQHWVADGHVEGDSLRVLYNTYESTGGGALDVRLTGTSLATFALPGLELTDLEELPVDDTVAWGSAVLDDGAYTYVYGSEDPGDHVRFAHVARVERGDLGAAWEFWDGTGWSDDEAASARLLRGVGTAYDVISVGDRYALVTQDTNLLFSPAFVAYTADGPAGPFTGPAPLFEAPSEYPGKPVIVYDARVHTAFSNRGRLTVSYNVNSLDPDDNYADTTIYRPRFVDVAWPPAAPDPATVPGPPRSLTATNGEEGLVHLAWSPPAGGPAPTRYRVYQRDTTAGQAGFSRYAATWTGTSADLPLLADGKTYELRVTAENGRGEGPPSNTATLVVDHRPPPAPANLRAEPTGRGLIRLDWDATSANVVHDVYQRDVTAGEDELTRVPFANPSLSTLTVGPLTHGHEYEFQVTARHGGGDSAPSNRARAVARWPAPPVPTGLTATTGDDGDIALSWTAPADGVWYWIYQRDVTAGETELTKLPYPVTEPGFLADGAYLEHDHVYEFAVASVDQGGESPLSDPAQARSLHERPPVPTGLEATPQDDGSIDLTWDSVGDDAWYWIYVRDITAGETEPTKLAYPVTTASFTATQLAHDHEYELAVASTTRGGDSDLSDSVRATARYPLPAAPTNLQATAGDGEIALDWTPTTTPDSWYWIYTRNVSAGEEDFTRGIYPVTDGTSATLGGLANGDTYEIQITAINAAGESPPTDPVRARPLPPLPGAPTGLTATAGTDGSITLTWTAPGPDVWYWLYQRDVTAGEDFVKLAWPIDGATTFTATGLRHDHRYEFQVAALNLAGDGPRSNVAGAVSHYALPPAPTGLRAASSGSGKVALDWESAGEGLYYWVYERDATPGHETPFTRSALPTDQLTAERGLLADGHTYEYKVSAENPGGEGPTSATVQVVARADLPARPTNLRATAGSGEVALTWTASTTPDVWYLVSYRNATRNGPWQQIDIPITTGTSYTLGGLVNGETYQVKVVATSWAGNSAPSNVVRVTPRWPVPAPPTNLRATSLPAMVRLRWTASTTSGSWYWVEHRDTATGQGWQRVGLPVAGGTSFDFTGLPAHRHQFRVVSTNAGGESAPSNVVAATPLAPSPPSGLTATPHPNKVVLRWSASPTPNVWYWVEHRDATTGGRWQRVIYPVTNGTSFTMTGLSAHTYQFRVRSVGISGDSAPSNVVSARPQPPLAPSGLTATAGNARVQLRWNPSPTPDTWYLVYFRDVTVGGRWVATTYPTPSTTFNAAYLTNGHLYEFKVASVSSAGQGGFSNLAQARPVPPPPAPPSGARVASLDRAALVSWNHSPTPWVTYWVYARDATTNGTWVIRGYTGHNRFIVRDLRAGHLYQFYVRAVDPFLQGSTPSNTVSTRPAGPGTVVEYNWWGYEVHFSRAATSRFVELAGLIGDGSEGCGILGYLGLPGRVVSAFCGVLGGAYGAMGDAAAAYHRRGNCATMNVTWLGVPWVNEDRYGTENCY